MKFDLSILRKAAADLAEQVKTLRADIERLKRRRDDLIAAPAAKADLKAAAAQHLANQEAAFAGVVRAQLEMFIRRPERLNDRELVAKNMGLLAATGKRADAIATFRTADVVLLGLLGPAITRAYLAEIDNMQFDEGPTNADRALQIAKIDDELGTLQRQLEDLTTSALGAGIVIEGA